MRIVFVAPFGLRHKTTVWARTLPLAQGLLPHGFKPTILIPAWDSPEDAGTSREVGGVSLVHTSLNGGLPGSIYALLRTIREIDPGIVHIVKPRAHAGIVQWLLWQKEIVTGEPVKRAKAKRTRLLLLDADDWEQAWAPINKYPPLVARFLAWQEEWGMRHAHGMTVASRWLETRAAEMGPSIPRLYLPNGVNIPSAAPAQTAEDRPRNESQPHTVLYFTRYAEVSPAWLADFAIALKNAAPGTRLVIAGAPLQPDADKPFREALQAALNNAIPSRGTSITMEPVAPEGNAVFLGSVSPQALPALYATTSIAIFPARPEPLQQAKCSVRMATTLLNGIPVVASAVGEQTSYGANGAAMLLPADASPAHFAQAVVDLLASPETRKTMVANAGIHLARHYQWTDLSTRLAQFYTSLLDKQHHAPR